MPDEELPEIVDKSTGDDQLVQIKSVEVKKGKTESVVEVTDRVPRSAFNAFKHGKRADLPALCDQCKFGQNEDVGGTGQCHEYEAGAVCSIREDIAKYVKKYNTRNLEDLQTMTDDQIKMLTATGLFADLISKWDGNLPDKHTLAVTNTWIKLVQLARDLQGVTKLTAKEVRTTGDKDFIMNLLEKEVTLGGTTGE